MNEDRSNIFWNQMFRMFFRFLYFCCTVDSFSVWTICPELDISKKYYAVNRIKTFRREIQRQKKKKNAT
jgi:hypothetical protein